MVYDQSYKFHVCCTRMGMASDSSKAKKSYLVLTCGRPSLHTSLPKGKGQDGEMCSDDGDESNDGDDDQTVSSRLTKLISCSYILELFTAFTLSHSLSCLLLYSLIFFILSFFTRIIRYAMFTNKAQIQVIQLLLARN